MFYMYGLYFQTSKKLHPLFSADVRDRARELNEEKETRHRLARGQAVPYLSLDNFYQRKPFGVNFLTGASLDPCRAPPPPRRRELWPVVGDQIM